MNKFQTLKKGEDSRGRAHSTIHLPEQRSFRKNRTRNLSCLIPVSDIMTLYKTSVPNGHRNCMGLDSLNQIDINPESQAYQEVFMVENENRDSFWCRLG